MHRIYEAILLPAIKPKTILDSPSTIPSGPFLAVTHPAVASHTIVRSSGYSNFGTDNDSDEADVARADGNFGRLSIDHISSGADNETAEESKAMIRRSLDRRS